MMIEYWNAASVILIDFMSNGATILKKLEARIRKVQPALDVPKVLLQHGNTRLQRRFKLVRSSALAGQ